MKFFWLCFCIATAVFRQEVGAGCVADPEILKKIETLVWSKYAPPYFLETDCSSGIHSVIFSTEDALPEYIGFSVTQTYVYESHKVPFYIREFQDISYDKVVYPPMYGVAHERSPGIVTIPERNQEFLYLVNWAEKGVRAAYIYSLVGECYSSDAVITIDPHTFKSRDVLCKAINEVEKCGLKLNKTKTYFSNYNGKTKEWENLKFDYNNCLDDEYVKDIDSFILELDKKKRSGSRH